MKKIQIWLQICYGLFILKKLQKPISYTLLHRAGTNTEFKGNLGYYLNFFNLGNS